MSQTQRQQRLRDYLERRQPFYLDLLRQMVEINSFTANPSGVNALGELTAAAFAGLGFSASAVQSINPAFGKHLVLSKAGRSGRQIGLISHLDTVYPQAEETQNDFAWRQIDNRIYGPGTVDIKGGTVMIYMVLSALREVAPQAYDDISWYVLLNASEEELTTDFGELCLRHLTGETLACLVFEGGRLTGDGEFALVVARKGRAVYRIEVEGKAAHPGSSHKNGANAIVQLAHTIRRVAALTDYERDLTFNVGTVAGGTVVNRVPHLAVASAEMRAFSPAVFEEGISSMLALNEQTDVLSARDRYPCRVSIELLHRSAPWPRNQASDNLLQIFQEAGRSLDIPVAAEERGGLSDGNLLWDHLPTLDGLGPAGGNAHCSERSLNGAKDQEYVLVPSFVPKALLNTTAILRLIDN
ncbi:MAG: M20/M25/M40 family metallo-hydrolase [Anaerolineae bacterium]